MTRRRVRIGELPYSFFGGQGRDESSRKLYQQMQANNDHLMSELRNLAKHLNDVEAAITELTQLIQSTQPS